MLLRQKAGQHVGGLASNRLQLFDWISIVPSLISNSSQDQGFAPGIAPPPPPPPPSPDANTENMGLGILQKNNSFCCSGAV